MVKNEVYLKIPCVCKIEREVEREKVGPKDVSNKEFKYFTNHSSVLAWKVPCTEEPGGLQSMGSQSQTRLSNFTFNISIYIFEKA